MTTDLNDTCLNIIKDYQSQDPQTVIMAVARARTLATEGYNAQQVAEKFAVPAVLDRSIKLLESGDPMNILAVNRMIDYLISNGEIDKVARHPNLVEAFAAASANSQNAPGQHTQLRELYCDLSENLMLTGHRDFRPHILPAHTPGLVPDDNKVIWTAGERLRQTVFDIWDDLPRHNPQLQNKSYSPHDYWNAMRNVVAAVETVHPSIKTPLLNYVKIKEGSVGLVVAVAHAVNAKGDASLFDFMNGLTRSSFPDGHAPYNGRDDQKTRNLLKDRGRYCAWSDIPELPIGSFLADELGVRGATIVSHAVDDLMKNPVDGPRNLLRYMGDNYSAIMQNMYGAMGEVAERNAAGAGGALERMAGIKVLHSLVAVGKPHTLH